MMPPPTDTQEDDEQFCPDCFAGMTSSEHHEKCVAPLDRADDVRDVVISRLAEVLLSHLGLSLRWADCNDALRWELRARARYYIALVDDLRKSQVRPTGAGGCPAAPGAICCNRVDLCRPGGDACCWTCREPVPCDTMRAFHVYANETRGGMV